MQASVEMHAALAQNSAELGAGKVVVSGENVVFLGDQVEFQMVGVPPLVGQHAGDAAAQAVAIVEAAKATGGYCLVLGLKDGALAEALAEKFTVIAIDPNAAKVDTLRRHLHERGIYGSKISVHVGDPLTYSFPPFIANLVVTETPRRFNAQAGADSFQNIFHKNYELGKMISNKKVFLTISIILFTKNY